MQGKNTRPRNGKGFPHGLWQDYYADGSINFRGEFINGERVGYWIISPSSLNKYTHVYKFYAI